MNDLLQMAQDILVEHNYTVGDAVGTEVLLFEGENSIGFVVSYDDVKSLADSWDSQSSALIARHQLGLRRSMEKSWNSYLVLLTKERPNRLQQALLDSIEENLIGTRKIARAGVATPGEMARALLPLLPLQNAPRLDPVNMEEEIRIRTTHLPNSIIDAFLSRGPNAVLIQLMEES